MNPDQVIGMVDRIATRLALADDTALEGQLKTLLPQLLQLLCFPDINVKNKVVSVLSHINKRVKDQEQIKLPVRSVLDLYLSPQASTSPFLKNFSLIYLQMGYKRCENKEKGEIAPILMTDISKRSDAEKDNLLTMFLSGLDFVELPNVRQIAGAAASVAAPSQSNGSDDNSAATAAATKATFAVAPPANTEVPPNSFAFLKRNKQDAKVLLDFLRDVLLFTPNANTEGENPNIPRGLSIKSVKLIKAASAGFGNHEFLSKKKIAILKFLLALRTNGNASDNEILPHLLIASCDSHHTVIRQGEDGLKQLSKLNLEEQEVVNTLYELFLGNSNSDSKPSPDQIRTSAAPALKIKIMSYLMKSVLAANTFPSAINVLYDSVLAHDTTPRQMEHGMQFFMWVLRQASDEKFMPVAPLLLEKLLALLDIVRNQAGATISDVMGNNRLRGAVYEAIGSLGKRAPSLLQDKFSVLEQFFDSLTKEESSVRMSVQEGLSHLIVAFKNPSPQLVPQLERLLLESAIKKDYQSRFAAAQCANRLFPFNHVISRLICLLCTGDVKLEVREEAQRGLDPEKFINQNPSAANLITTDPLAVKSAAALVPYPPFPEFVLYVDAFMQKMKKEGKAVFSSASLSELLRFCQKCMEKSAATFADAATPLSLSRSTSATDFENLQRYFDHCINSTAQGDAIQAFQSIIEEALKMRGTGELQHQASASLRLLVSLKPSLLAKRYSSEIAQFKAYLYEGEDETREVIASVIGVLFAHMTDESQQTTKQQLIDEFRGFVKGPIDNPTNIKLPIKNVHGSILALGNICAKSYTYWRQSSYQQGTFNADASASLVAQTMRSIIFDIYRLQQHSNTTIAWAAIQAIGDIGRTGGFAFLLNNSNNDTNTADKGTNETQEKRRRIETVDVENESALTKQIVVRKLLMMLRSTSAAKTMERIIVSLGLIGMGERDPTLISDIVDGLMKLGDYKGEEVHFTIGETLACLIGGNKYSTLYRDEDSAKLDDLEAAATGAAKKDEDSRSEITKDILKSMISRGVLNPMPMIRCSTAIWLLAIIKYSGSSPTVLKYLKDLQQAFSMLLTDSNEVTQEVSSKGLALVYQHGDAETRKELVSMLLDTLSSGKKSDVKITQETQLFPEGALGKTPTGSGMSTYKELCAVANDIGKPEMIYQFLSLANHSQIWNAKKAAAFGAVSIITSTKEGEEEIKKHLPTLVPKLYRYQFDPNPRINEAMTAMWRALIPDPKKAVDMYLDGIITEVVKGLTSNLWRVREASCFALSDLLSGRRFAEIQNFLEDVYVAVFRVSDDVKESVQKAGKSALRKLGSFSVKSCNPSYTPAADVRKALDVIVPILLKRGILDASEEVRAFSVQHILLICQAAGEFLRPHIAEIVGVLLEQMTVLEPAVFNYLMQHTASMNVSAEEIEAVRLARSRTTPMSEAIEICQRYIDESVLTTLVPRLIDIIKHGVGLPTRTGAARFVGSLAKFYPQGTKAYTTRLLKAMSGVILSESSPSVVKALSNSIAYVVALSPTSTTVKNLVRQILDVYLDPENNVEAHSKAGMIFDDISKLANNAFKNYAEDVLPVAFIGRFDSNEEVADHWKSVWTENVHSDRSGARTYIRPIIELCTKLLDHSSWKLKQQGGAGLKQVAEFLGAELLPADRDNILTVVSMAVPGRLWDGKHVLLDAIAAACDSGFTKALATEQTQQQQQPIDANTKKMLQDLLKLTAKECKRNTLTYRLSAVASLRKLIEAAVLLQKLHAASDNTSIIIDKEIYKVVREALWESVKPPQDETSTSITETKIAGGKEKNLQNQTMTKIQEEVAGCVAVLPIPPDTDEQELIRDALRFLVENDRQAGNVWSAKIASLAAIEAVLKRITNANNTDFLCATASAAETATPEAAATITTGSLLINSLMGNLDSSKPKSVKIAAAKVLSSLYPLFLKGTPLSSIGISVEDLSRRLAAVMATIEKNKDEEEVRQILEPSAEYIAKLASS